MKANKERLTPIVSGEVLIVDDIAENLQVLGNILTERNLDVSFASNGKQALEAVAYEAPDLILLDIAMPEMDGFEVCRCLQDDPNTQHIPIIFLTAKTESESIVKGFELGAVDYVTKPFNHAELVSRVFTHLELNHSRQLIEQQNDQLRQQNVELQELNATKDKFFSIVAHDLKNPFNTLIGFSELLLSNYANMPSDKIQRFHDYIHKASQQGFNLLENLLEWSRSQTGRLKWKPELFKLENVAIQVEELLAGTADSKSINLQKAIDSNIRVYADPNMIMTVIRNLVSNALKFTDKGGVVTISATAESNEMENITVTVSDTGIGISPEDQEKLFRLEHHHTTLGTEEEKGTGLGLLLCKEFVEKNGGKIWVESKPGQGSHFRFTLPAKT